MDHNTDPRGPTSGSYWVLRGGFWSVYAYRCRVAVRLYNSPGCKIYVLGFRLVRSAP